MITLFKEIKSTRDKKFKKVYLVYSFWFYPFHKATWFCRVYPKNWEILLFKTASFEKTVGESYGKTKFQAYRNAILDFKSKKL